MIYEYKVTQPMLPPPALRANKNTPMMDHKEMTWWMNDMASQGWDFVGHGTTSWTSGTAQSWWIFKRPKRTARI